MKEQNGLQYVLAAEVPVVLEVLRALRNLHCFFSLAGGRRVGASTQQLQSLLLTAVQCRYTESCALL